MPPHARTSSSARCAARARSLLLALVLPVLVAAGGPTGCLSPAYDLVIRGGTVYDGGGGAPFVADVAVAGDRVAAIGDLSGASARKVIDATGLAVAPGFINMLSWSVASLIEDGDSQSEVRQGVTTQIMGEGFSYGPLSDVMKKRLEERQGDIRFDIEWSTLAEYLAYLERRGISQNVASFVGHTTLREYAVGLDDRDPTDEELELMKSLLRREMEAGALGLGSALIYAPASYAETAEIIELCRVAAAYGGMYISHIRSEGNRLVEEVEDLIRISREAGIPAEIYHLKAAGRKNWPKLDEVISLIEEARSRGLRITADMYTYNAASTGLNACIPLWARDGGPDRMRERFRDPETRRRIVREIAQPAQDWENLYDLAGSPENILLVGFKTERLKPLQGKTLAEAARLRGVEPAEAIVDLMLEDGSRVDAVYFLMSEENVRKQIRLPWVSFGSDASSQAPKGVFLRSLPHPRAYGCFARLLGKYVREEKVIPLEEAIRKLTSLPAANLGLEDRGRLAAGMYADIVVFDPATIADRATYENPHRYAVGVRDVVVNGTLVLEGGVHTGAHPGRALKRARRRAGGAGRAAVAVDQAKRFRPRNAISGGLVPSRTISARMAPRMALNLNP